MAIADKERGTFGPGLVTQAGKAVPTCPLSCEVIQPKRIHACHIRIFQVFNVWDNWGESGLPAFCFDHLAQKILKVFSDFFTLFTILLLFRKVSIAENLNCDYSDCEYSEVSSFKAFIFSPLSSWYKKILSTKHNTDLSTEPKPKLCKIHWSECSGN